MVDSVSVRFKNASVSKKMPLNIIVFTVECGNRLRVGLLVLKTLSCRGLRVGPSKPWFPNLGSRLPAEQG